MEKIKVFLDSPFGKRLKSFTWRFGSFVAVTSVAWLTDNIHLMEASPVITGIIVLVLGEVTKYLNK